ncbi:response regulator transcription factor [Sphingomonas sp. PAMC 26605]|uniref:response regulator transcription factor n=1 Tax=Sphingomonas sp. PAMC 26605 TaxID=1112214 RepID=UPI00026CD7F5|nr:response regulator transcription factor [Sphingomonas sp. PAMC 26605]
MIRILIVDDHPVLREGIAAIVENQDDMVVAGEAEDGSIAIEQYRRLVPDVVLMDIQMPRMDGLEAIATLRKEFPAAKILVLTTYAGDVQAVRALRAGAAGYLLKSSLRVEMLDAIRKVHDGRRHIQRDVADGIARHVGDEPLTDREISVLRLVAIGQANKQVAQTLGVSEETVKAHLKTIFAKLQVSDRTHAITVATQRGMLSF